MTALITNQKIARIYPKTAIKAITKYSAKTVTYELALDI